MRRSLVAALLLLVLGPLQVLAQLKEGSVVVFNEAFATSIAGTIRQLMRVPWSRILHIMSAGFDSMWEFTYSGDSVDNPVRDPADGLVRYVNDNSTLSFMWTLFKSFEDEQTPVGVDFIFAGFENGKFLGYSAPLPGYLVYAQSGNASCPNWPAPAPGKGNYQLERCRKKYKTTTNPVSGTPTGPPDSVGWYDPRLRSWYQPTIDAGGVRWSSIYLFSDDSVGITAGKEITTANGDLLGVFGADYKLSSIETALKNLVETNGDTYTAYIVDNSGRLIASNIAGVALDPVTNEWGVLATESAEARISATANELLNLKGTWSAASGVKDILIFVPGTGLCWVKSAEIKDEFGLHWHVVAVEVVQCGVGSYLNNDLVDGYPCVQCPEHTTCDGYSDLNSLDVESGFWRISSESTVVLECPIEGACVGGSDADNYCEEGYEGLLCSLCDPKGYYFTDELKCEECEENVGKKLLQLFKSPVMIMMMIVALLVGIWGCILLFAFVHTAVGSPELPKCLLCLVPITNFFERNKPIFKKVLGRLKLKIKALLSFSQISSNIAFNCAIAFPVNFEQVLSGLTIANFDVVPSLACYMPTYDLINSVYYSSIVPLCLVVLLLFMFAAIRINHKLQRRKNKKSFSVELLSLPQELKEHFTKKELYVMSKTFKTFDKNGDGSIDLQELKHVLAEFGFKATDKETQDMLNIAVVQQLDVVEVQNHFGTTSDGKEVPMERSCGCGNIFADKETGIFCRRCGVRRPPAIAECKVKDISFTEFCGMVVLDKQKERDSKFAHLVAQVEAKVTFIHGQNIAYTILFLTFLVFVSSSTTLLQFFKCTTFDLADGGEVSYLAKDLSISCDSQRYKQAYPFAVTMLFVYPIGIPLIYMVVLLHKRHTLTDKVAMKREALTDFPTTGHVLFLTEQYKPEFYYFECIECVRRLSLASVVGLADEDSTISPIVGVLLSLVFIAVFSEFRPFKAEDDCTLGVILSYSITLIFLAALLIKMSANSDLTEEDNSYMGILLMFVLFAGPFAVTTQIVRSLMFYVPPSSEESDEEGSEDSDDKAGKKSPFSSFSWGAKSSKTSRSSTVSSLSSASSYATAEAAMRSNMTKVLLEAPQDAAAGVAKVQRQSFGDNDTLDMSRSAARGINARPLAKPSKRGQGTSSSLERSGKKASSQPPRSASVDAIPATSRDARLSAERGGGGKKVPAHHRSPSTDITLPTTRGERLSSDRRAGKGGSPPKRGNVALI